MYTHYGCVGAIRESTDSLIKYLTEHKCPIACAHTNTIEVEVRSKCHEGN